MVRPTALLSAIALLAAVLNATSAEHVQPMIRRGEVKVRGVNLGGWLVGEHWMSYTSPVWSDVNTSIARQGEWKTMEVLGHAKGDLQFDEHRRSWITRKDIAEIASYGLNTVRVPVGHWIINGGLPTANQTELSKMFAPEAGATFANTSAPIPTPLAYLDELIYHWATDLNVSVMLSLHAHQDSQNGYDHSAPQALGHKHWADSDANYQNSIAFATFLANRYKNATAFLGMNLMNEPSYSDNAAHAARVLEYYEHAYKLIRGDGNDCVLAVSPNLSQQTPPFLMDFMRPPLFQNVWHEFHRYYVWGFANKTADEIIHSAETYANDFLLQPTWAGNPVLVGEWCLDGPRSAGLETNATALHAFAKAQVLGYEQAGAGWTFWSWRHDDENTKSSGWSMRQLLRSGDLVLPWHASSQ